MRIRRVSIPRCVFLNEHWDKSSIGLRSMITRTCFADKQGKVGLDVCATKKACGKFDTTY